MAGRHDEEGVNEKTRARGVEERGQCGAVR
jgi:hypothetical protein